MAELGLSSSQRNRRKDNPAKAGFSLLVTTAATLLLSTALTSNSEAQSRSRQTAHQREAAVLMAVATTVCSGRFIDARSKIADGFKAFERQFSQLKSGLGQVLVGVGNTVASLASLPSDIPNALNAFQSCAASSQSLSTLSRMPPQLDNLARQYQDMRDDARDFFGAPYDEMIDNAASAVASQFRMSAGQLSQCMKGALNVSALKSAGAAAQAEIVGNMNAIVSSVGNLQGDFQNSFNSCMGSLRSLTDARIQFSTSGTQAAWAGFSQCFMAGAGGSLTGNVLSDLELTADAFSNVTPLGIRDEISRCVRRAGEGLYEQVNPIQMVRSIQRSLQNLLENLETRIGSALRSLSRIFSSNQYDWKRMDINLKNACRAFRSVNR